MPHSASPHFSEAMRLLGRSLEIVLHTGGEPACALEIDRHLVVVLTDEIGEAHGGMHALLVAVPPTHEGEVFKEALRLNLELARVGGGVLLYADDAGGIVFSKGQSWHDPPDALVKDFHAFVAHARELRERLMRLGGTEECGSRASDGGHEAA